MVNRDTLVSFINKTIGNKWLEKAKLKDEHANGVQILGAEKVNGVALGVSLNEAFLRAAIEKNCNFCIFHHGLDPRTYKSRFPTYTQKRLKLIFQNGITVMGFHYALDAHPKLGNNATIIKELGAKITEPLFDEWGYVAKFEKAQDVHKLAEVCQRLLNHEVFVVGFGPEKVKTIGVVSGAAKPYAQEVAEMQAKGVELFISGETSESTPHKMKEAKINYFVCGHYATEVFGVKNLGGKIRTKFKNKVKVEFIDVENPI